MRVVICPGPEGTAAGVKLRLDDDSVCEGSSAAASGVPGGGSGPQGWLHVCGGRRRMGTLLYSLLNYAANLKLFSFYEN